MIEKYFLSVTKNISSETPGLIPPEVSGYNYVLNDEFESKSVCEDQRSRKFLHNVGARWCRGVKMGFMVLNTRPGIVG